MKPMAMIRLLTAVVLFLILAKANVWADTSTHLVLAVGYRALLLIAPLFMCLGLSNGLRLSLLIGIFAVGSMIVSTNTISMFFFALSMAVSGYICKYVNSKTTKGAADNKVSLNIGSLVSGALIFLVSLKSILLGTCLAMLIVSFYFSLKLKFGENETKPTATPKSLGSLFKRDCVRLACWILIGVATGIKLTGVFAILPQYLVHKTGSLPYWYGSLIMINSLGVIFFQHKILYALEKMKEMWTWALSASAMLLLAIPHILGVENIFSAIIWMALLTFGECALSRYDKIANDEGYLFPKEVTVGIGSFVTVYLSREFPSSIYLSGLVGIICLTLALSRNYSTIKKPASIKLD